MYFGEFYFPGLIPITLIIRPACPRDPRCEKNKSV